MVMLVSVTMNQPKNTNKEHEGFIFKFKQFITFNCIYPAGNSRNITTSKYEV